jgi:hypothetical protein
MKSMAVQLLIRRSTALYVENDGRSGATRRDDDASVSLHAAPNEKEVERRATIGSSGFSDESHVAVMRSGASRRYDARQ